MCLINQYKKLNLHPPNLPVELEPSPLKLMLEFGLWRPRTFGFSPRNFQGTKLPSLSFGASNDKEACFPSQVATEIGPEVSWKFQGPEVLELSSGAVQREDNSRVSPEVG